MDAIAVALMTDATWTHRVRERDEAFRNWRLGLLSDEKLGEIRNRTKIDSLEEILPTVGATGGELIENMIPVLPRRLSTTGRIHEDTIRPWGSKRVGEAWKATEISSVREQEVARALWRLSSSGGTLKADDDRILELENGKNLKADDSVACAIKHDEEKGTRSPVATWMAVRHGWAKTDEIHHARLIKARWMEKGKDKEAALLVPLPVADVYDSRAPFDAAMSPEMVGVRAHPKLARINAMAQGASLEVLATLTQGDIVLDEDGTWVVTTFDAASNVAASLPALLGGEKGGMTRRKFTANKLASGDAILYGNNLHSLARIFH